MLIEPETVTPDTIQSYLDELIDSVPESEWREHNLRLPDGWKAWPQFIQWAHVNEPLLRGPTVASSRIEKLKLRGERKLTEQAEREGRSVFRDRYGSLTMGPPPHRPWPPITFWLLDPSYIDGDGI